MRLLQRSTSDAAHHKLRVQPKVVEPAVQAANLIGWSRASRSKKGVNLPGKHVDLPILTDKDILDLEFGVKHDVDFVALSFVRNAADVKTCRDAVCVLFFF